MSRYAYLVCPETKQMVFLGKIVQPPRSATLYFHLMSQNDLPNSENIVLMKVIMKFLAQHLNKELLVLSEEELDRLKLEPLASIDADPANGISADTYIANFPG